MGSFSKTCYLTNYICIDGGQMGLISKTTDDNSWGRVGGTTKQPTKKLNAFSSSDQLLKPMGDCLWIVAQNVRVYVQNNCDSSFHSLCRIGGRMQSFLFTTAQSWKGQKDLQFLKAMYEFAQEIYWLQLSCSCVALKYFCVSAIEIIKGCVPIAQMGYKYFLLHPILIL